MAIYFMPKYAKADKKFPVLNIVDVTHLIDASLSEQIQRLTTLLEVPPEELNKRQAACEEVHQILHKLYPDSSLLMYGPSVNSFGIKGCDVDLLFVPFRNYCNLDFMEVKAEEIKIPDPASILSGEVSNDVLTKLNERSHLKFIRNAIKKNEKIGKKASIIALKKGLFLRFTLKNDDVICNISASNKLTVFNSELLQFYGRLDERVKPLVICLVFWAKSLGFNKQSFFSIDSFTWLVIFFLQSINPPILPSVQRLKELSGSSRMIAGWDTAFCTNARRIPKSKNTLSVGELFTQFFDFYFHFDFSQNVVSPHRGRALPIKEIQNSKDARMADFEIKAMNIQDVFILSKNLSAVKKLAVFKLALLTASEMLKEGKGKMKLPTFFSLDTYQQVLNIHYNSYFSGKPEVCFIPFDHNSIQKFESLQAWYDKTSEAVYDVLQYGLLIECEVTDKVNSIMKKDRAAPINGNRGKGRSRDVSMHSSRNDEDGKTSSPYDLQLLISMQCLMYSKIFVGRKTVEVSKLDSENDSEILEDSVLGIEHRISKSVLAKNPLLKSPNPFLVFNCECYRHTNPELTDLIVVLKPLSVVKIFNQVSQFLVSFLPEVVKKIAASK